MSQQRISKYQVLEEIASGGQATVYRVWDTQTGSILALKVMHPHLTRDTSYVERFKREAAIASALDHPNITRVFEIGQEGDTHFMSMAFLPLSLHYLIQSQGKLPVDRAVHIAYQICQGMQIAHEHKTFHRDIKPQNILLAPDGTPKITDFGIARAADLSTMTRTGMVMGTPHYMSPEQADGRADIRSDIYSMGIVLYQMLTGDLPFSGETPWEIIRLHREVKPTPLRRVMPGLPRGLDTVVARCLEKDPNRRYQTPALMAQALQQVMPSVVTSTPQPQVMTPPQTQQPTPKTTPTKAPAGTNLCVRCGTKLEPGQRYCTACGAAVTGPAPAPPTPPRPAPAAQPRPAAPPPRPSSSTFVRAWDSALRTRHRGPLWARFFALAALLAVVGGVIYLTTPPEEPIEPPVTTSPAVETVGEQIWARELPGAVQLLAVGPEGELFVTGENGEFRSVGPDGAERWRLGFGLSITSANLASNDLLHVSTDDGTLLGLRASDGSIVYRSGVNVAVMTGIGPSGDLYAISEDGFLFRYPSGGGPGLWSNRVGQKVLAPPVVGPDGTVYVGTVDPGAIHAISPDGVELWSDFIGPVEVSPAFGSVYVANADGFLFAYDADGSFRWERFIGGRAMAPPVVSMDSAIYVLSADGLFLFNDFGALKWSAQVGPPAQDGLVLDPDGTAYVLSQDGTVWAVDRDGNVNEFFHDPGATWLAVSPQGLLYMGGTNRLTALKSALVEAAIGAPTLTPFRPATATPAPAATPAPITPVIATRAPAATPAPITPVIATHAPAATPTPTSPEPEYGGVLRMTMLSDPFARSLHPYENRSSDKLALNSLIFSRLFRYDSQTASIVGDLAETWQVSESGTTWMLQIRSDARFHDGSPVTALDVQTSLQRMAGTPVQGFHDSLEGVRVVDEFTLLVLLRAPFAPFLDVLAGRWASIVPNALIASGTADVAEGVTDVSQLIGSGPFMIEEYVPEQRLVLTWNGDYYKADLPYLDGIDIFFIQDRATRLAAFRAGETDFFGLNFTDGITLEEERQVVANGNVVFDGPGLVSALWFDTQSPLFDDARVRRAVAMAIDREVLTEIVNGGGTAQFPVPSLLFPEWARPQDNADEVRAFNPELAKQLLAEAGYPDGFDTIFLVSNTPEENLRAAQVIVAYLGDIGIQVKIEVQEAATFRQRLSEGAGYGGMLLSRMPGSSIDVDTFLSITYGADGPLNYGRLSDPVIEEMIQIQRQAMDQERCRAIIHELDRYIAERAYVVPLPGTRLVQAYTNNIQDFAFQASPDLGAMLERVWLGEGTLTITPTPMSNISVSANFSEPLDERAWRLVGSARHDEFSGAVVLTEPVNDQVGYLFSSEPINTEFFKTAFSFAIGGGTGADGFAFVVSRSIPTEADLSNVRAGGDFGAGALDGFGVEFDTFQNGSLDTSDNHVGVTRYPDMTALTAVDFGHNLRENGVYNATIIFESGRVQVYLDNPSIGLDQTLVLEYNIPGFVPFDGYFGFVGVTGGSTDAHLIFDVVFDGVAATGTVAPTPTPTAASFPTPTPTSLPVPGPGGIINESGSVGGVHWGTGFIADSELFDFGTGSQEYSQRNNTGGYFYSAQASEPPQSPTADTVLFANVQSSSICASGAPGYLGVTSGELADLGLLSYSAHHSINFWTAQYDECYDGLVLAFRQGDQYGLIEPISVDQNGSLQFNWWYGEPGITNFTIALRTARVPIPSPTPTPTAAPAPVPGFLPTPVQIAPSHGSVFNHFPRDMTLQWEPVSWPRPLTYVVGIDCFHCCVSGQWCTDVGVNFEDQTTATRLEHSWVGAQPGRWRVWWVDDLENESPKSDWWNFEFTV